MGFNLEFKGLTYLSRTVTNSRNSLCDTEWRIYKY